MTRLPIIITSFIAFAALAVVTHSGDSPLPSAQAESEEPARGITVNGTGTVEVEPDQAQLWFGVESAGATAKAALAANATQMRKLLDALRAAGATDLQTQHVSLSPRYVERPVDASVPSVGGNGYTAHNSVSATVKQLGRAGAVIDAAVAAGANHVSGPMLTVADPEELYREALEAAVADARESAEALADAADLELGRVTAVVEGGSAVPPPTAMAARAADEAAGSTPIEPGEQEISATVTVTFAAS
jgi:uncharacterized protein YggE